MKRIQPRLVFTNPVHFLAFGFGSGLAPLAPGTAGSLVGALIAWWTADLPIEYKSVIAVTFLLAGVWICGKSARDIGVHDHPGIVWDEIAAIYAVLLLVPATIPWWLAGFALFRLFDIWKPWPIRDLDHRLKGGLGIMLDDVVAALYTAFFLAMGGWLIN